ncbi:MAG: hypothetical protein R3C18_10380 [Planctomycetaceae bacterium]
MTSPLRKKHPTTPSNTRRWTAFNWLWCLALSSSVVCGVTLDVTAQQGADPIQRLKSRSAEMRWEQLKESLKHPRRRSPGAAQRSSNPAPPPSTPIPFEQSTAPAETETVTTPETSVPAARDAAVNDAAFGNAPNWRSADNETPRPLFSAPTPQSLDRGAALEPAPDALVDAVEPVVAQPQVAKQGTAPPFPTDEMMELEQQQAAVATIEEPATALPVEPNPLPENLVAGRLNPDDVFLPAGEGTPLVVPNPALYQQDDEPQPQPAATVQVAPGPLTPDTSNFLPPMPEETQLAPARTALVDLPPAPQDQNFVDVDIPAVDPVYEFRPITQIEPFRDYSPTGRKRATDPTDPRSRTPEIIPLPENGAVERAFATTEFQWEAANVSYNPLYFEDPSLERYGHTYPEIIQPVVSMARFGVQAAGLPYQMALDPVWRRHYPLGYYRPGDPAPALRYQVPFNAQAATTATMVYTGMFLVLP